MTGPEHYKAAEHMLRDVVDHRPAPEVVRAASAMAQVHATLALAAATALNRTEGQPERNWQAWFEAAGTKKPKDSAA